MTYQLAQELKDGGFPQAPRIDISGIDAPFFGGFYFITDSRHMHVAPNFLNEHEWEAIGQVHSPATRDTVKIPTLSELIAACGEDFIQLTKVGGDDTWRALGLNSILSTGPTPEEAVARLWFAINGNI